MSPGRSRQDLFHEALERQDAIIVYFDGKEVLRENLPGGPDAHGLFATQPQDSDNDGVIHRFPLAGVLEPGEHILAISLHNANPPSSDLRLGGITLVEVGTEANPTWRTEASEKREWADFDRFGQKVCTTNSVGLRPAAATAAGPGSSVGPAQAVEA